MKRPAGAKKTGKSGWVCPDPDFATKYPHIAEGLCDPFWEDGKPRELWSLGVGIDGDMWKLSLVDRENRASAYTSATTIHTALELMEEALAEGRNLWRRWKK